VVTSQRRVFVAALWLLIEVIGCSLTIREI
jgi:hypothetical protein